MAETLPLEGRILDHGCGHGLFALHLASSSFKREVFGFDHDTHRIEIAKSAARNIPNIKFMKSSFLLEDSAEFSKESLAGIALIDVLHYFNLEDQLMILKNALNLLRPGGILIFREVNPEAGLIAKWNSLYEKIATASGFTQSSETNLTFRIPRKWEDLLSQAGFTGIQSRRCSSIFFADVLFIGEKKNI